MNLFKKLWRKVFRKKKPYTKDMTNPYWSDAALRSQAALKAAQTRKRKAVQPDDLPPELKY